MKVGRTQLESRIRPTVVFMNCAKAPYGETSL
jgi:hypothetical protein